MAKFSTVHELVSHISPSLPIHILRPHVFETAARWFCENFPGNVVYSVKSNPDADVLGFLHKSGIHHFDVTSLAEIQIIDDLFADVSMHFMNPVKSRESIRQAYFDYGVRDFSLDCYDELEKILEETDYAQDLRLFVRLGVSNESAAMSLSGKFGVSPIEAADLLKECQHHARRTAICFHVGSQCMDPVSFRNTIVMVANLLETNGLSIDILDIGGGFPSIYPGMTPPALRHYMETIEESFCRIQAINPACELWCEPGRALVAEGGALLVRVELRKGNRLYINDGVYGTLFDAGMLDFHYPVRLIRPQGFVSRDAESFSFYGPTCDSIDKMKGPFRLPADIREGDYIEIGQLGAYGANMQSRFNGFYSDEKAFLEDAPMLSMFGLEPKDRQIRKIRRAA